MSNGIFSVTLGESSCCRKFDGKYKVKNDTAYGYVVPFKPQLIQLLSVSDVCQSLSASKAVDEALGGILTMANHFYQSHPDAVKFWIANPIGSQRTHQKFIAFYWT